MEFLIIIFVLNFFSRMTYYLIFLQVASRSEIDHIDPILISGYDRVNSPSKLHLRILLLLI